MMAIGDKGQFLSLMKMEAITRCLLIGSGNNPVKGNVDNAGEGERLISPTRCQSR